MDDVEEQKIKAEIDEICQNIKTILNRVENEDPGWPPAANSEAEAGDQN
jgi:hypothetical protein